MIKKADKNLFFLSIIVFVLTMVFSVQLSGLNVKNKNLVAGVGSIKSSPCTPSTTVKCGTIRITKDTIPDDYQDFSFNLNIPSYIPISFILDDDSTLVNSSLLYNTASYNVPPNGNFTLTENSVPGYSVSVSCSDPTGGTIISGNTAYISLSNAEAISCLFKNIKLHTVCVPNTWTQKADFGGVERTNAVGFSIGTKGYIGTGDNVSISGTLKKDFWEYNPGTNVWTQKADFGGVARNGAVGFSIGTKGYIGTGNTGVGGVSLENDFWEYDSFTNTWTQKADFGGSPRFVAIGFSIGTKGYIGTGNDIINGYLNDFWEYDPTTNVWAQKANFGGTPRVRAAGFSSGTKGYVGTGSDNVIGLQNDFWEYNPTTNTWTQKSNFPGPARDGATGFFINNKGYLGMGTDNYPLKDFWLYDPVANTWAQKANFGGIARFDVASFSIGNKGYIGTGFGSFSPLSISKDFWEYCP